MFYLYCCECDSCGFEGKRGFWVWSCCYDLWNDGFGVVIFIDCILLGFVVFELKINIMKSIVSSDM